MDEAGLMSEGEAGNLRERLDQISEDNQFDVAVVTVDSLEGKEARLFAADWFDACGLRQGVDRDGIILVIAMGDREWAIATHGFGIPAFTDAGQAYIADQFQPALSDGDYYDAFMTFGDLCEDFLIQARKGETYDVDNMRWIRLKKRLPVSITAGIVLAFVAAWIHASAAKASKKGGIGDGVRAAREYIDRNSLRLHTDRAVFLRRRVISHHHPKKTSGGGGGGGSRTFRSSSGGTFGGSKGKF